MFLKTPRFWYEKDISSLRRFILYPISRIYALLARCAYWRPYRRRIRDVKVVAIGGVTVGGSGKSIVVASLAEILLALKKKTAVLSVGYGRSSWRALRVDPVVHTCVDVGDEPLMLSKKGIDVFVSKNRWKSARLALREQKYDVFLLDDGVVQKYLAPNINLVVVDASQGIGNGEALPLGPLRIDFDTLKHSLNAIILLIHGEKQDYSEIKSCLPSNVPLIIGKLQQDLSRLDLETKYLAFCGIGYPRKFFDTLNRSLFVVREIDFPDHYPFSEKDMTQLLSEAESCGARLVTTEKDFARIPERFRELVSVVPIKIMWNDMEKIATYLL